MHLEQKNMICKFPLKYKFSGGMFTFCLILALAGTAQAQPAKELTAAETFEPVASYCLSESCLPNLLFAKDEPEIQLSTNKKNPVPAAGTPEYNYQLAQKYYGEKVFPKAIKFFTQAAEDGHVGAQSFLGRCYYKGEGVELDSTKAAAWLTKASEQDDHLAQYYLGLCYENGCGVEQNFATAASYYENAAFGGIPEAQNNLGRYYYFGRGVERDYQQAASWFLRASNQKLPNALF